MDIELKDKTLIKMWETFQGMGAKGLFSSHYELAELHEDQGWTPQEWKKFLTYPTVSDWITEEMRLVQQTKVRKMVENIDRSNSTGQAQLLNTLISGLEKTETRDEGPAFIYCYIPLDQQEEQVDTTRLIQVDPFLVKRGLKHGRED